MSERDVDCDCLECCPMPQRNGKTLSLKRGATILRLIRVERQLARCKEQRNRLVYLDKTDWHGTADIAKMDAELEAIE